MIAPAQALAHVAPEFFDSLTDAERLVLPYIYDLWLRPEQRIPRYDWRYYGYIAGRGYGKTFAVAIEINRRVEAGEARSIALMAPTEPRVDAVQIQTLIDAAPPWFRPERYDGGLIWPNGVRALAFTPEAPGRTRSGNFDLSWLVEIVDWSATTRMDAFKNITTATRVGRAQVLWDTTSKGKNDVILHLKALHVADPHTYPIQRGSMYDNPLLSQRYIAAEVKKYPPGTRGYEEEIEGKDFEESAGALWRQAWLDDARRAVAPSEFRVKLFACDPALSPASTSDECGIMFGGLGAPDDAYLLADKSGRYPPEEWGDIVVAFCADEGAAGGTIERNHLGDNAAFVITERAKVRGLVTYGIPREDQHKPFPHRKPGVIYIRETISRDDKGARAQPPAVATKAGRVHLCGTFPELETELTTWEPGTRKSPNRLDAFAALVAELLGLALPAPKDTRADAQGSAAVYAELQKRLRAAAAGRRVGI